MSTVPWHSRECACPRCQPAVVARVSMVTDESIDTAVPRKARLHLRLPRARRSAVAAGRVRAMVTMDRPSWDVGDRVTVVRGTHPSRDDWGVPTTVTDEPLHLRIADAQGPIPVGKLATGIIARQLGHASLADMAREWFGEPARTGGTSLQKQMVADGLIRRLQADDTPVWFTTWQTEEVGRPRFLARAPQDSTDGRGRGYTEASDNQRALLDAGEAPPESWSQAKATESYHVWAPVREGRAEEAAERRVQAGRRKKAERDALMKSLTVQTRRAA